MRLISKITKVLFLVVMMGISFVCPQMAWSAFDVDWSESYDSNLQDKTGDRIIAQWLVNQGYYSDFEQARTFAHRGYIGYDNSSADPFFWNTSQPLIFEIVQENAAYADSNKLGYYSGTGATKSLTEIFDGTQNGPEEVSISNSFGLYLSTPEQNTWFTDRAENIQQIGSLKNLGGNAQGLIYELRKDQEWLVAWEDLDATNTNSDRDYNDMFVKVTVAPEPISSALFLIGGACAAVRLRRKLKVL